jgi:proteasome lid subunit RPN8/RPN11
MSVSRAITNTNTRLRLAPSLRKEMETRAAAGYPNEVCGLLIGRANGDATTVEHIAPARNLNTVRARDRYALDPNDFLRAERFAAERDLGVVGIWHSHPDHPAIPSQTDLDAAWPEYSYVIVSVFDGRVSETRSWRLDIDRFNQEEFGA